MPDVAYTPRDTDRRLSTESTWTYRGEPFVPTFVVEIESSLVEALNAALSIERCEMNISSTAPVGLADRPTPRLSADV
ncbi:hypothetical protein GQ600_13983 [Phytophthora cactorum]|nr:hypothetical protein GQ600_13983 [Phytophthora cactorum]